MKTGNRPPSSLPRREDRKPRVYRDEGEGARPNRNSSDKNRRTDMRAMRAETFNGYQALKLVDLPKPAVGDGRVLLRMTAAGVTPLDQTILSGKFPHHLKAPLVLGNEGAGVVEEVGETDFPVAARVMFFGAYGA